MKNFSLVFTIFSVLAAERTIATLVCYAIGKSINKIKLCVILGLTLGVFGLLAVRFIYTSHRSRNNWSVDPENSQDKKKLGTPPNVAVLYTCPRCSNHVPQGATFCPRCGLRTAGEILDAARLKERKEFKAWHRYDPENIKCYRCWNPVPRDARFCPWCGKCI
jgi:hypothetical protein